MSVAKFAKRDFHGKTFSKLHTTEVHLKENPLEFNVWQPKKSNDHFSATAHNEREDYTAKSIEYPTLARYLPQKNLSASQCTFSAKQLAIEACVFTEPKHSARPIFCAKLCNTKLNGLQLPVQIECKKFRWLQSTGIYQVYTRKKRISIVILYPP